MNSKTEEVSENFCVNCHDHKKEINKLLKQKAEQQISINKLEETINTMQTNINNLHENIAKLKNDTEITKSMKRLAKAMKRLAKLKKCSNLQLGLKLMIFRLFLNFLTPVLVVKISNFIMVKITYSLKFFFKILNLEKKAKLQAIDQFLMYLS